MIIDEGLIRRIVLTQLALEGRYKYVPVGVSNKHVHLSENDLYRLFGWGYQLNFLKEISQPGQYASKETVTLVGPKGRIEGVRVLGPTRPQSQVEISISDAFALGYKNLPVRLSGDLEGSIGIRLIGPKGEIELERGLIIAARHLHLSDEQAVAFGVHDRQIVSLRYKGERGIIFDKFICRVGKGHELEAHIDTDEANASGIRNGDILELIESSETTCNGKCHNHSKGECSGHCDTCKSHEMGFTNSVNSSEKDSSMLSLLDLVTEQDVNDALKKDICRILCTEKGIITPAAFDRAKETGIEIVRAKGGK